MEPGEKLIDLALIRTQKREVVPQHLAPLLEAGLDHLSEQLVISALNARRCRRLQTNDCRRHLWSREETFRRDNQLDVRLAEKIDKQTNLAIVFTTGPCHHSLRDFPLHGNDNVVDALEPE